MTVGPLKVSVVVATYCSGAGLDRLVASLDAQTLPTSEWEAIFVDDGSPDDTYERLAEIQRTRPHVRIERIPNSGWPCRPRNVGTDLARGEYIAYMDHDDELYPDALRAAYEFATRYDADVVNGKEARTHDSGWAIDQYRADSGQVRDRKDFHPLIPTNPHKLYRRALLVENGIRFREGGRVLWEDIFFNVLVARHAKVIATMASTPYYHWFTTPGSSSTTFVRSRAEWWHWLDRVVTAIDEDLAGDDLASQRRLLRNHQYRSRLMDAFNNLYAGRPAGERKLIFEQARTLQGRHFSEEDDESLNRTLRMRAQLLRRGYPHLLDRLTVDDPNIPGVAGVTSARWDQGVLHLETTGSWVDAAGRRHRLVCKDGRLMKDLPAVYHDEFPTDLLDMTDDIAAATVEIGLRSHRTRITWMAPSTSAVRKSVDGSGVVWSLGGTATIDPATAAMGRELEREVWELSGRCTLAGVVQQRIVHNPSLVPAIHVDEAGVVVVSARPDGTLVMDFDQSDAPLSYVVRATGVVRWLGPTTASIAVEGVPTDTAREFPTTIDVNPEPLHGRVRRIPRRVIDKIRHRDPGPRGWRTVPATVRIADGQAWIVLEHTPTRPLLIRIGQRVPGATPTMAVMPGRGLSRAYSGPLRRLLA